MMIIVDQSLVYSTPRTTCTYVAIRDETHVHGSHCNINKFPTQIPSIKALMVHNNVPNKPCSQAVGDMAWKLLQAQAVYGCNVTAIAPKLFQAVNIGLVHVILDFPAG